MQQNNTYLDEEANKTFFVIWMLREYIELQWWCRGQGTDWQRVVSNKEFSEQ